MESYPWQEQVHEAVEDLRSRLVSRWKRKRQRGCIDFEDLAHDGIVRCLQNGRRWGQKGSLEGFLLKTAINCGTEVVRKEARRKPLKEQYQAQALAEQAWAPNYSQASLRRTPLRSVGSGESCD